MLFSSEPQYQKFQQAFIERLSNQLSPHKLDSLKAMMFLATQRAVSEVSRESPRIADSFYLFIGEIKENDLSLPNEVQLPAARFLMRNPNANLFKDKRLDAELERKSQQIIRLIRPCLAAKVINAEEVLYEARQSPFVEVCSYIFELQGDVLSAIKVYVDSSATEIRFKVFKKLNDLLANAVSAQTPLHQSKLCEAILSHLSRLVEIDYEQTTRLLVQVKNADIHTLFASIKDSKDELALKVLKGHFFAAKKKAANDSENYEVPANEAYLYIHYIKLLAKLQRTEVIHTPVKHRTHSHHSLFPLPAGPEGAKVTDVRLRLAVESTHRT